MWAFISGYVLLVSNICKDKVYWTMPLGVTLGFNMAFQLRRNCNAQVLYRDILEYTKEKMSEHGDDQLEVYCHLQ
jgi:hypothetical protein